jgi:hypothetical protein
MSPNGRHSSNTKTSAAVVIELKIATLIRLFIAFSQAKNTLAEPEKTEGISSVIPPQDN